MVINKIAHFMEIFIKLLIVHHFVALFSQTFFNHRYAAHAMFRMNRITEKFFFVLCWVAQGPSYLSPYAYAILHRMHHANTDTEDDPHSPSFSKGIFDMMRKTLIAFNDVFYERIQIEEKYKKNVPNWNKFDKFASSLFSKALWVIVYASIYLYLISSSDLTLWNYFILVPMFLAHCLMGPVHGAIINYFAHKYGYRNFETTDTSKNLLSPASIIMLGEGYHNNHHKLMGRPNFGVKWYKLELDPVWPIIWVLDKIHVIRLNKTAF